MQSFAACVTSERFGQDMIHESCVRPPYACASESSMSCTTRIKRVELNLVVGMRSLTRSIEFLTGGSPW